MRYKNVETIRSKPCFQAFWKHFAPSLRKMLMFFFIFNSKPQQLHNVSIRELSLDTFEIELKVNYRKVSFSRSVSTILLPPIVA